jgi:N-acetylglucosaminyldiphosphoundecaprenol N-acetyl-beta-D-mannosaminyltransferase
MMPTISPSTVDGPDHVWMAGVCLDALTEQQVIGQIIASSLVKRGGWIATPNIYLLRRAAADSELSTLLGNAELRVADGVPLIWASRLAGGTVLRRVAGSSLTISLCEAAARYDRSVYVLGGLPGAAALAAERLCETAPNLRIVGAEGPMIPSDMSEEDIEPIIARLEAAQPDIVLCGVGFPKQERFIAACRIRLPHTWFLACGASINFAAGVQHRAPVWMQRIGLEWFHRLLAEPRRLAGRYAADVPFAVRLLARSAWQRVVPATAPTHPDRTIELPDVAPTTVRLPDAAEADVAYSEATRSE